MRDKRDFYGKKNRRISRKITGEFNRKKARIFSELYYDFDSKNLWITRENSPFFRSELYYQGVAGNGVRVRRNGKLKGWGVFLNFIIIEHYWILS
ncbi:hypothetical protein [uncultured Clostridium sp.]|uniref:hypothetical protein n=1 Tax=uncultured Clostridium sp. TaxID=59620 RepID=UPI0025D15BA3|nr:hypothetical protein [uncultured Clostridium sp.]